MPQSGVARTDSPAATSLRPPVPLFFLRCTKASMMLLSALKRMEATFITAAKKILNRRGASTHPRRRPCSTATHLEHTLSSSPTHARIPSGHRCYGAVQGCHVFGLLPLRRFLGLDVGYHERNEKKKSQQAGLSGYRKDVAARDLEPE